MGVENAILFILWTLICLIVGGLATAPDQSCYRQGVEDAWAYMTEPFDVKHEAAARILRGRPLPPIPEE